MDVTKGSPMSPVRMRVWTAMVSSLLGRTRPRWVKAAMVQFGMAHDPFAYEKGCQKKSSAGSSLAFAPCESSSYGTFSKSLTYRYPSSLLWEDSHESFSSLLVSYRQGL